MISLVKTEERREIMQDGRLLAMSILFFAAIAILAPLAFFAGLERGRGGMSAQAAELPQKETITGHLATRNENYSGANAICGGGYPFSEALARLFCGSTAPETAAPIIETAPARQRTSALSRSVARSIAEMNDPLPGAPIGLAIAPDKAPSAGQSDGQTTMGNTGAVGFPGGGGIPASLTPFILSGQGASAPPLPPAADATIPPTEAPPNDPPLIDPPAMVVPLPAAISLFCGGLAFLLALARRKQRVARGQ